jgi:hypothetical protein
MLGARTFFGTLLAGCALADVAAAHHGIANFDLNKDISLSGAVAELAFVNPHSWLYVNVAGADGAKVLWKCEMRAATVLRRSGWSDAMFAPGTQVTVTGSPDRHDPNTCYLATITFADGTTMNRYGQREKPDTKVAVNRPERLANGDPNISGDWAAEQRVMTDRSGISGALVPISVADQLAPGELPQGVRAFPGSRGTPESLADDAIHTAWSWRQSPVAPTEAGKKAAEGFDPSSTDNPRLHCAPTNILFDWTFETFTNRITQDESSIRIQYGAPGIDRTIHLNDETHPAGVEPSVAGHSIGRWDSDVLIVDTVGFKPGVLSADTSTLHSAELHVVERFSLDRATNTLRREYAATDSLYFTGEYKGADAVLPADLPYEAPSCEDLSYVTGQGTAAARRAPEPAAAAGAPAASAPQPAKRWWEFWK